MTSVGLLVDQLFSPIPGGMGTYVRELMAGLARTDPSLEVVPFHARMDRPRGPLPLPVPGGEGAPVAGERTVDLGVPVWRLYPSWAILRRPALPDALARLDLIHSPIHAAVPPPGPAQRLVVTVHDLAFLEMPHLFPRQWRVMYRAGLARAVRSADAIIAVSRHTAEDLERRTRVAPDRLHVIPLAASLPPAGTDPGEVASRLKVRRPYVLFVGTLEPRKNLVVLVRAFRRMAARGLPHSLVLAGPMGWHHQALMAELALDAPGEVTLTGALGERELDALYRGAAAFVYPSLYEGFGLPVLEAMARGVPCAVSTSSSLPEVAGEAALPVDPRSVAGLADAVERIITDETLAERLRQAGLTRATRFSWDQTSRLTLEVYKSLL